MLSTAQVRFGDVLGEFSVRFSPGIRAFIKSGISRSLAVTTCLALVISASVAADISTNYRLGAEDVVAISVVGHPEFSNDYYIPVDGSITLPVVGKIIVIGKTLDEVTAEANTAFSSQLLSPNVMVSLKMPRVQRVYVLGSVSKPGFYDAKPEWRITEAIAAAGGLLPNVEPSHCKCVVMQADSGKKLTVGIPEIMAGSPTANLPVRSGDVITIDDGEMPIYVMGEVIRPGLYRLQREKSSVMEALAAASGATPNAAISKVKITHISGLSEVVDLSPTMLEGKEPPNTKLQSGDMVLVPEYTARVAVLGFVKVPGVYPLKDGKQTKLSDAIGFAGGLDNQRAGKTIIAVVRVSNGQEQRAVYDYRKFLKAGDQSQNPVVMPGDVVYVPETKKPDWDIISRMIVSLAAISDASRFW